MFMTIKRRIYRGVPMITLLLVAAVVQALAVYAFT